MIVQEECDLACTWIAKIKRHGTVGMHLGSLRQRRNRRAFGYLLGIRAGPDAQGQKKDDKTDAMED